MQGPRARARLKVGLTIAIAVGCGLLATRIETDNQLRSWTTPGEEDALRYESFLETFGTDEFVLVAISGPELLEEASLDRMLEAVERLEDTPYVHRVFGPPTLYRDLFGGEDAEALLTELTETDFYRNLVISADGERIVSDGSLTFPIFSNPSRSPLVVSNVSSPITRGSSGAAPSGQRRITGHSRPAASRNRCSPSVSSAAGDVEAISNRNVEVNITNVFTWIFPIESTILWTAHAFENAL